MYNIAEEECLKFNAWSEIIYMYIDVKHTHTHAGTNRRTDRQIDRYIMGDALKLRNNNTYSNNSTFCLFNIVTNKTGEKE